MNVALHSCSECGGELVVASGNLLCGRCLLGSALSPRISDTDATSRDLSVLLAKPTPALGVKFHYFGDYELLEEIARGGMGVVFRARQTSLNRVVALKMILAGQLASKEAVRRFRAEAEAAARLDHPHIVPIYEVGEHDGLHYFTMKLVEGGSMADALQARRFAPRDAARMMAAIARALSHAHERNILHRDLKPSNILLDRDGQPHITDFGLAKVVSAEHASQTAILGTPAYAAPEQALGAPSITASADVYSLGVILYEMLSGRLPFETNSPLERVRRAKDELPPPLRDCAVDADLEAICFKCLSADAQSRYASAAACAADLELWLRGLPVRARRATPLSRARYWMKRRPALAGILMLSMILVTAVPVLWREIRIAREEKNAFISSVRAEKIHELEALRKQWADLDVPFVSISSELRSAIWKARSSVVVPNKKAERYSVGIYAHERPVETAGQFAPLLGWLEESLSLARSNRVRLDLRIYKHNRAARTALVHGAVDVVRLGAGPFLFAQEELAQQGKTVEVLAKARPGTYTAVLFARSDAGITNINDLRGRSLALGSLESTISGFHIPAVLAEAGLTAGDLRVQFYRSHNEALSEVIGGKFEAGAAKTRVFEKHRGRSPGLVELTNVSCISMPWVARSGLRPEVAALFRRSLLSLNDQKILELLPDQPHEGFESATAAEYEPMREHHRSAERFVSGADGTTVRVSTARDAKPSANQLP